MPSITLRANGGSLAGVEGQGLTPPPGAVGLGYGTDAARIRTRHAFEVLEMRMLLSDVMDATPAPFGCSSKPATAKSDASRAGSGNAAPGAM